MSPLAFHDPDPESRSEFLRLIDHLSRDGRRHSYETWVAPARLGAVTPHGGWIVVVPNSHFVEWHERNAMIRDGAAILGIGTAIDFVDRENFERHVPENSLTYAGGTKAP